MKTFYRLMFAAALSLIGCGSTDVQTDATPTCPPTGCPNASCIGADDGTKCVGFTASEKRGWAGFCVSSVCTEYVPAKCVISSPAMTFTGCDGSGMVTGDARIEFKYAGAPASCSGIDGEFGYCAPGTECSIYQGGALVGQGVCE